MKLLTAAQMQELDRRTIEEVGLPGVVLMENAGRGVVESLCARFFSVRPGPVVVVAGKGNNGGDGYVVARDLLRRGWTVRTVVLADRVAVKGDAAVHLGALLQSGGEVFFAPDAQTLTAILSGMDLPRLVVDALFGTGLSSKVDGHHAEAIAWINRTGAKVVAVDIPSGIDAGSGRILGCAVSADLTVTFALAKVGHAVYPGAGCAGDLVVLDIGIPRCLSENVGDDHLLVEAAEAALLCPRRPAGGHKGTFGHLLVIAGETGKSGAAVMSAEAGLRSGAGLVTVACPAPVHSVLEVKLTEAMTVPLPAIDGALSLQALAQVRALWVGKSAVAAGPGLGRSAETVALVRRLVAECPLPLILDADALNAVSEGPEILLARAPGTTVLTPHPGEMARLAGSDIQAVEEDRLGVARDFACRYQVVLVLKGARTVIALPDGRIRVNGSGNPGLASGGMGDVLTGLIGGLLAQGLSPADAAVLGTFLHGRAADRLSRTQGDAGLLATDLVRELPATRRELTLKGAQHAES